jgi:hypothetical protein
MPIPGPVTKVFNLFRAHAGWFVLASWLLLLLAFGASLIIGIPAAISALYHPLERYAPFNQFAVQALNWALAVGAFAAVGSSIARYLKFRLAASALVVLCWSLFAFGATGTGLQVKPGPEHFQRYVGTERFSVPWLYAPEGVDQPNTAGLTIRLCLSSLRGTYDKGCRGGLPVNIRPQNQGFTGVFYEQFWRSRMSEMTLGPVRDGHQTYVYTAPPDAKGHPRTSTYLARYDSEGRLTRLVVCYSFGSCQHHAIVGSYLLTYSANESAFSEWEAMDSKLASLIDSWRVN